jgi:hypothetical protein
MKEGVWLERTDDIRETEEDLIAQVSTEGMPAFIATPAPGPEKQP